jgi:hypothetical protein
MFVQSPTSKLTGKMKEYKSVQSPNFESLGKTIENCEKDGWQLLMYQVCPGEDTDCGHFLLFERKQENRNN